MKAHFAAGTVTVVALTLCAGSAHASKAKFTEAAIGCPSKDGVIEVYQAAGAKQDFNTVQAIVEHYNCQWFEKGVELTLISRDPMFSVVVMPHVFSKDVWMYVPTRSVEPIP